LKNILDLDSKFYKGKGIYYYINVYIPSNLDIISLINNLDENKRNLILKKSPNFPHQAGILKAMCLFLNKLCWLEITNKDSAHHGYYNFAADILSKEIGVKHQFFSQIVRYLEEMGVIKINPHYSNSTRNKFSKSFKFSKEYAFNRPKLVEPRFIVAEKETSKFKIQDRGLTSTEEFLRTNLEKLRFSIAKHQLLEIVRNASTGRKVGESLKSAEIYIEALEAEEKLTVGSGWFFNRSPNNGRLNTTVTALKKELRPYLTYNGQHLVELDQHASQPFLLLKLYQFLSDPEVEQERALYYSLFSSDFYEAFARLAGDSSSRDAIKSKFIKFLNSKPKNIDEFDKATKSASYRIATTFKKHFPILWNQIQLLKTVPNYLGSNSSNKGTHTQFAYYLQNLESKIFIDGVCSELMELNLFCYTIHDCIGVVEKDALLVKEIIEKNVEKEIGLKPVVNLKLQ